MIDLHEFDALAERVSNWGRWGSDDQRGALNLISPDVVARAVTAVVTGEMFMLGMDLSPDGPQNGTIPGRINPLRTMLKVNHPGGASRDSVASSDDIVVTPTQAATHWDALSHCSHRGSMYNGIPADAVDASGAAQLGIDHVGAVASRGVLLDVARHENVDVLPDGFAITSAVLASVEAAQGTPVEEGDVVLVRTGRIRRFLSKDTPAYRRKPVPGLDWDAPLFLHDRAAAAVALDTLPAELIPSSVPDVILPVHILCLVRMGMMIGENWVLEDLAEACATDGRFTFLLSATPERFTHSTGGMVNPVAIR